MRLGGLELASPAAIALVAACAACGASQSKAAESPVDRGAWSAVGPAVDFSFESIDDRPVGSESTRGKPTVVVFVTTGSLPSQAQIDFLVPMAIHDAGSIDYCAVALETRENRELVELYAKALKIPFPVAVADDATMQGGGPFGDVRAVPVMVLLDAAGRVVWRAAGRVVKSDEIRSAMSRAFDGAGQ